MIKIKKSFLLIAFIIVNIVAQIDQLGSANDVSPSKPSTLVEINPNLGTGISVEDRQKMANALMYLLADGFVLYTKSLNFHWNVRGNLFLPLHEFFGKIYLQLQDSNDLLAERIRALGGRVPASLQEFLKLTQIKEHLSGYVSQEEMIRMLLSDFETVIKATRKAVDLSAENNDMASNNMLAGLLEQQEKTAWMLRSHLQ